MALTRISWVLTVHITVVMGLAMIAFASSDTADAFAIYWEGNAQIHQDITREALELTIELPNGKVTGFSRGVVLEIENHNIRVDDDQGKEYTDRHFDNDDFSGGSRRLSQLHDYIVDLLVHESFFQLNVQASVIEADRRVRKAREQMGEALHTLQDFYAHSNWVERSGLSMSQTNSRLGKFEVLDPASPDDVCDINDLANSALTSAFSDGYLLCLTAPDNKCDHGYSNVIGCEGINKDSWQQAADDVFFAARSQAVIASRNFVRDTLLMVFSKRYKISAQLGEAGALQATQLAVCQFMGVADPVSTCTISHTVTVQKLNYDGGSPILEGLVQSSGSSLTPAIDCGAICQGSAIAGTQIVLSAADTAPWIFVRWEQGGACAGSTSRKCAIDMNSDQTALAVYAEPTPIPVDQFNYDYSCFLEVYPNTKQCIYPPDATPNFAVFHEELSADYGGTPESGGGFAYVTVDGQVSAAAGQTSIESRFDASAVGQWSAHGKQAIIAQSSTNVLIASNTLPPGTPVTVRATYQVKLHYARSVTLSESYVQWYVSWPYLQVYVSVLGAGGEGPIGFDTITGPSDQVSANGDRTVDLVLQTTVGSLVRGNVNIRAESQTVQAVRAHVQVALDVQVSGPYLIEANGLDVYFIDN